MAKRLVILFLHVFCVSDLIPQASVLASFYLIKVLNCETYCGNCFIMNSGVRLLDEILISIVSMTKKLSFAFSLFNLCSALHFLLNSQTIHWSGTVTDKFSHCHNDDRLL